MVDLGVVYNLEYRSILISPLGVVVGVSELLLTSLAKMTVQVGKTVGQAVSDSMV